MLTVSDLKAICEYIEHEWGSDSPVCVQIRDEDDIVMDGALAEEARYDKSGTVFVIGKKFVGFQSRNDEDEIRI